MKVTSKVISIALSLIILASAATSAVGAVTIKNCNGNASCVLGQFGRGQLDLNSLFGNVKELCKDGNCSNIKELCKNGNCVNVNELCKNGNCADIKGLCKDGSCADTKGLCKDNNCADAEQICKDGKCNVTKLIKSAPSCKATEKPTQPEPSEKVKPTAPAAETVKPTQPPTKPTEAAKPATKPTEPVQIATEKPAATEAPTTAVQETSEFNLSYEDEVIRLVNIERSRYGLSPLSKDSGAVSAAHIRVKETVRYFSHTRPNGTSCFTVAGELGLSYRTLGENIAYGYSTPQMVVNGWMNSEGHRRNILSASFTKIGVGCYSDRGTLYWSQFFAG